MRTHAPIFLNPTPQNKPKKRTGRRLPQRVVRQILQLKALETCAHVLASMATVVLCVVIMCSLYEMACQSKRPGLI